MHHDEKGRISRAQSKVALSMRTMGQMAAKQAAPGHSYSKEPRHAYGERHSGLSGMTRMGHLKEVNKGKKAKSRVVLRGQKSDYRKAYTKHGARMHKEGLLKPPA